MARVKSLIYHGISNEVLRDYYSIVYDDQMVYILTMDGKQKERHSDCKLRTEIVEIVRKLL